MAAMRRESSGWRRVLFMDEEWMRWLEPVLGGTGGKLWEMGPQRGVGARL